MIHEVLMGVGTWELRLDPDRTPASVWAQVDPDVNGYAGVHILPTRIAPTLLTDTNLLTLAIWSGRFLARDGQGGISGDGAAAWLGDHEGKSPDTAANADGTSGTYTDQTFRAWVDHILTETSPAPLTAGTLENITSPAALDDDIPHPWVPRTVLDYVCDVFGAEWRVNPDFTVDAGSALFVTTPTALVVHRDAGHDPETDGLQATDLAQAVDLEDYTSKVVLVAEGVVLGSDAVTAPYRTPQGDVAVIRRIVEASQATAASGDAVAAAQRGRFDSSRKAVTVRTDEYDIHGPIAVGDTIAVYNPDPQAGLLDLANQWAYRGRLVHPAYLRVRGMSWPVADGMGVVFRYHDGAGWNVIDLTPYVMWEPAGTVIDVGANPRTLTAGTTTAGGQTAGTAGQVAVRRARTTNQSINTATTTPISFGATDHDYGDIDYTTTVTEFVIGTPGVYHLAATVQWAAASGGVRMTIIRVNATDDVARQHSLGSATANADTHSPAGDWQLAAGDVVELLVFQNSGSALNVTAAALAAHLVRRT